MALKQNCDPKKEICDCMRKGINRLWVNLRRVFSVYFVWKGTVETSLVTQAEVRCLLGSSAAKRWLQVLRVGPELGDVVKALFFYERWH